MVRVYTDFSKDLSSTPSTHIRRPIIPVNSSSKPPKALVLTCTYSNNTHMQIIKTKVQKKKQKTELTTRSQETAMFWY